MTTRIPLSLALFAALAASQPALAVSPVTQAAPAHALPAADAAALDAALKGDWRDPKNSARDAFGAEAFARLRATVDDVVVAAIPTIETLGGGSVRCMLAEVHLPVRN